MCGGCARGSVRGRIILGLQSGVLKVSANGSPGNSVILLLGTKYIYLGKPLASWSWALGEVLFLSSGQNLLDGLRC